MIEECGSRPLGICAPQKLCLGNLNLELLDRPKQQKMKMRINMKAVNVPISFTFR